MFVQRTRHGHFIVGLMTFILEFIFGDIVIREIPESRVWVFRGKFILPWLIGLIVLFIDEIFELILS